MILRALFLILISCLSSNLVRSQYPISCESAITICEYDTTFLSSHRQATDINNIIPQVCGVDMYIDDLYRGTNWLRYEFASTGEFLFTIYPISMNTDIDFLVFTSEDDCSSLTNVRCMYSGSHSVNRCMGTTGLAKDADDIYEYAGCDFFDDNYLAPLHVDKGDVVYVAIFNSDDDGTDYHIVSRGSATLLCSDEPPLVTAKIYPNPTAGLLQINAHNINSDEVGLEIYDSDGKVHLRQSVEVNSTIDISELPSGVFIIKLHNDGDLIMSQRIINIK